MDHVVTGARGRGALLGQKPIEVARQEDRPPDARERVRVEPPRLLVGGERLLEEPAVAAGVDEPPEELRIVGVAAGLPEEARQRGARRTRLRLEMRVELVG